MFLHHFMFSTGSASLPTRHASLLSSLRAPSSCTFYAVCPMAPWFSLEPCAVGLLPTTHPWLPCCCSPPTPWSRFQPSLTHFVTPCWRKTFWLLSYFSFFFSGHPTSHHLLLLASPLVQSSVSPSSMSNLTRVLAGSQTQQKAPSGSFRTSLCLELPPNSTSPVRVSMSISVAIPPQRGCCGHSPCLSFLPGLHHHCTNCTNLPSFLSWGAEF